jgi:vibriolysin
MNDIQIGSRSPGRSTGNTPGALAAALAAASLLTAGAAVAEASRAAPFDVTNALRALPEVEVVDTAADGVPTFLRGDLGKAPRVDAKNMAGAQRALRAALAPALTPLRLQAADLRLRKISDDEQGNQRLRYDQTHQGLDVIGGDLIVHVDGKGRIFAVNGSARGDIPATLGQRRIGESAVHTLTMNDRRFAGMATTPPRTVYLLSPEGVFSMAYETVVTGLRDQDPVRDKVYIDVETGAVLAVHPQIHFAMNRAVYSASNTTTLPGALKRSENGAASTDVDVNAAYEGAGATYKAYKAFWNRDSYDNVGGPLRSAVHYGNSYCNAFWDGTGLVYGDGNVSTGCKPLARAQDITAHELTHAVTADESRLVNSGEPGALNEAMSDIFGAFTEAYVDGGMTGRLVVSANTWKIGESVFSPASQLLRHMSDPAADGSSLDFYTGYSAAIAPHDGAGIANLAFYLMSQGGRHPRGKSPINVVGIGMEKAIRVFYEANVKLLTSNSNFRAASMATVQAAINLGYSVAERTSIANAWLAVGVGTSSVGAPVPPAVTAAQLTNNAPVAGLSGGTGNKRLFSFAVPAGQNNVSFRIAGGGGDADMYVKFGGVPTMSSYDCRPFVAGNTEVCTLPARAGTYYVMLNGYSAYSNVTLTAAHAVSTGGPGNPPQALPNGVAVIAGSAGSEQEWQINVPANRTLRISLTGGTGDADLLNCGSANPTPGGPEACSVPTLAGGTYKIRVRGVTAYSGATLKVTLT